MPCMVAALSFAVPSLAVLSSDGGIFGCSQNIGCGKLLGKIYGGWKYTVPWDGGITDNGAGKNDIGCDGRDGTSDNWYPIIGSPGTECGNTVAIFVIM